MQRFVLRRLVQSVLLLFVLAEVTPKTFAIQQTDRVALRVAPLLVALTRLFGETVHTDLVVKVRPRWRRDETMLDRLGL